ncbi:Uncharacterized protein dnm_082190 [Desulfonema magnum]|uniref:Uncharacterized protein n=1 Tax=Desulfonema magnum TaxID=45655 RepID=A0A975GTH2_9BACT|nr:Uncharacterized protein dnm_082190 [Desulfonema magnum]
MFKSENPLFNFHSICDKNPDKTFFAVLSLCFLKNLRRAKKNRQYAYALCAYMGHDSLQ